MHDTDFERYIYSSPKPAHADEGETLFTTFADRVVQHVDHLLRQPTCPALVDKHYELLRRLRPCLGLSYAAPAAVLCEYLNISPRELKQFVHDLRLTYRAQIGASRDGEAGGYYLISNDEESIESSQQMYHQAIAMLRVVHVLRSRQTVAELCGQVRLELEKEGSDGR